MTVNVLEAAVRAGVQCFFFASSACVYPEHLQSNDREDVSLCETDDRNDGASPRPQGLYGLEKLCAEFLVASQSPSLDVKIARFHNVFGPGGAWRNGREKAPAAFIRKALAIRHGGERSLEIWGSGMQRRSFLFIDDAVNGVLKLLDSEFHGPVNIGSDTSVTIQSLAEIALRAVGLDIDNLDFTYDHTKPVGVASRNSCNHLAHEQLGWQPTIALEDGIRESAEWMEHEFTALLAHAKTGPSRDITLRNLQSSILLDFNVQTYSFGILLPVTSRGTCSPHDCLRNLAIFAKSLQRTTCHDTASGGNFKFAVYLAIDDDDTFLLPSGNKTQDGRAERILQKYGVRVVKTIPCSNMKGRICHLWKKCASTAYEDGCDYMVLLGDDVKLHDEGWMSDAHGEFERLASRRGAPVGFGCVAFTDVSFPGMPTFPIISRSHMDIFEGQVVPESFVNQDGDPYLFQLYRRWGCATMFSSRISNTHGGIGEARYVKQHLHGWTFGPLDDAVTRAGEWLNAQGAPSEAILTLDVVVPCYRVVLPILDRILRLRTSDTCSAMFIIIVDNPTSPHIAELMARYGHRVDVRIRVNERNLGASASRNRGIEESAAEYVQFLDDDVEPQEDILLQAEQSIRNNRSACGFVGNVRFPDADTVFTTAVHLAGVTYFWDIADKIPDDVPWGVTANLIARRNVLDGVKYDLVFPKTGGGEDIDFCRKKRQYALEHGDEGFVAAPLVVAMHPWWNGGTRSYWRFYMWSVGDGALIKRYPDHSYRDSAPNSGELLVCSWLLVIAGALCGAYQNDWTLCRFIVNVDAAVVLSNVLHDCYRHLWRNRDRARNIKSSLYGYLWSLAVVESALIRMASEGGRVAGLVSRCEFSCIGWRFDWFTGRWGDEPKKEEKTNSLQRFLLSILLLYLFEQLHSTLLT